MNSYSKKVEATPEILGGLQQMSHDFHIGIYAETTKAYGDQEQKYIDELLSFSYKMVQTIVIVAGFGFTALGFVKKISLFVFGELLLISSIVYGIYSLKQIYSKIISILKDSSDKKYQILKERSDLFVKTILGAVKNKFVDLEGFETKLGKVDKELLEEFSRENKEGKDEAYFMNILILLFLLGSILILVSFVKFDLYSLLKNLANLLP